MNWRRTCGGCGRIENCATGYRPLRESARRSGSTRPRSWPGWKRSIEDLLGGAMNRPLHVAVVSRAVYPLHGLGGLERSVYDLYGTLPRDTRVSLITRPPVSATDLQPAWPAGVTVRFVPYRTFPFAGRRGTTILDRSTAYPWFGERAGRVAWDLAASASSTSCTGSAPACSDSPAAAQAAPRRSCSTRRASRSSAVRIPPG